jgi:hypothetical protein
LNKIVVIEWVDSSAYSLGWTDEVELDLTPITSMGFLIGENEESYAISHSIGLEGCHFDAFVIPKGCVRDITYLDGKENKGGSKKQSKGKQARVQDSEVGGEIRFNGEKIVGLRR